jgi:hypothetical protein
MSSKLKYALDANVFIEAQRRYYGFDLCPGFWDCLKYHGEGQLLISIDKVKQELDGEDKLCKWIKNTAPDIFVPTGVADVVQSYNEIINWINEQQQYHAAAIEEFAGIADGWLVAFAIANGHVVVTHEKYAPGVKKRIPIPNICKAFNVVYTDTFDMLRALKTEFNWEAP